jgi:hypothetical protein
MLLKAFPHKKKKKNKKRQPNPEPSPKPQKLNPNLKNPQMT